MTDKKEDHNEMILLLRNFISKLKMNTSYLTIVVALDDCNGIGRDNTIPWYIKNDLKFFRYVTTEINDKNKQNAIIIGRKTYETFPKPLPNRLNIVVSSNQTLPNINYPNVIRVETFNDAIKCANDDTNIENIFIAGGVSIYEEAMKTNLVKRVFLTRVKGDFKCTAVWSSFDVSNFKRIQTIPEKYQQFFDHSDENHDDKTPSYHLEIYEKDI
jgi:dihydrofolate reductase